MITTTFEDSLVPEYLFELGVSVIRLETSVLVS